MSEIATAFVAIRPDTRGFVQDLNKQLREQIKLAATPTIKVKAVVDQSSLTALRRELAAKPMRLPVNLVLAPGSASRLRAEIVRAAGKPIRINVVATTTRAAGQAAADAAANTTPARKGAAADVTSAAVKSEQTMLALTRQVAAAEKEAAKRVFDKTRAMDVQTQTANALDVATKRLALEEKQGTAATHAAARALFEKARAANELAATNVEVIARTAQARGVQLDPEANVAASKAQLKTASAEATQDEQLLARATATANAALERQAKTLITLRTATLEAATAIRDKAVAQQQALDVQLKDEAIQQKAVADEAARSAALAKEEQAALARQQRVAARIQSRIETNLAEQAQVPHAGVAAATDFEASTRRLTAAQSAATAAGNNLALALKSEDAATITAAQNANRLAVQLRDVELAAVAAARAQRALIPAQTAIHRIEQSVARGTPGSATVGTEVERARREATAAALAGRQLATVNASIAAGELKVSAAQRARLVSLEAEVAAVEQATVANLALARAAERSAVASSQGARAAFATTASFTGLRGAVLSSSLPFLAVTAGITAFTKAVGSASELQASLNVFQASTGASADQMERVSEAAKALGKDLSLPATSANDAAVALTELGKAGLSVTDALAAARGVLQLSAAASLSAADAAIIASTALNSFGLAGTEAEKVTNLFAGASIAAQGGIEDFGFALQQVAAQAHQAGLSVDQTLAALTQLAKAGIRGSDAGTSLRVELLKLVPGTKPAIEAFKLLGIQIDKTATIGAQFPSIIEQFSQALAKFTPQEQTDIIRDIFGQDAGRAAFITLTQGADAFAKVQAQIAKTGNASTLTEARAKGLSGAMDGLGSRTQDLSASLGKVLLPAIEAIVRQLSSVVGAADSVVGAFDPLITAIGQLNKIGIGGNDAFGQIALGIGAGLALKRIVAVQAAKRGLIATTTEEVVAEGSVAKAATASAGAQVTAQATVQKAMGGTIAEIRGISSAYLGNGLAAQEAAAIEATSQEVVQSTIGPTIASIRGISSAYLGVGTAARTAAAETEAANAGILASAFRTTKGILTAQNGLAIGIAAIIASQELSRAPGVAGEAGGILSSAATGGIVGGSVGSIFPGAGTVVGAAIGATAAGSLAVMEDLHARHERDKAKIKAEFDALSRTEQLEFLQTFPTESGKIENFARNQKAVRQTAEQFLEDNDLHVKVDAAAQAFVDSQPFTRAPFTFGTGGLTDRIRPEGRNQPGVPRPIGIPAFLPDPSLLGGAPLGRSLEQGGGIRATPPPQQTSFFRDAERISRSFTDQVGKFLVDNSKETLNKIKAAKNQLPREAEINLALAQADSAPEVEAAITAQIKFHQTLAAKLFIQGDPFNNALNGYILNSKQLLQKTNEAIAAAAAQKQAELDLLAELTKVPHEEVIAGLRAERSPGLADDTAHAERIAARAKAKLDAFDKAHPIVEKATAAQRASNKRLREGLETNAEETETAAQAARDAEKSQQESAASQAASDAKSAQSAAEHALDVQQDNLEFLAEKAGFQGKAEENFIAFLRKRARDAKGNAEKLLEARKNLDAALEQQADALQTSREEIKASQQLTFNLKRAILATAASAAALTDTKADDLGVLNRTKNEVDREIAFAQGEVNRANRLRDGSKKAEDAWKNAKIALEGLRSEKNGILAEIKEIKGGSGFTLNDLFKEANRLLSDFGSNISSDPMIGGDARRGLAANIAAMKPDQTTVNRGGPTSGPWGPFTKIAVPDRTDPIGRAVASGADKQVAVTTKTNVWLEKIFNQIRDGNPNLKPKSTPKHGGGVSADVAAAKFANSHVGGD